MPVPGSNIRLLRTREGLSLRALADAVGTDAGNLSKIETGKSGYSEDLLKRIAHVLNVSLGVLFSEAELLQAAVLKVREVPVLSAEQLAEWIGPDTFEPADKQAYFHTDLRRVSAFGFGIIVQDAANMPDISKGDALIFDVKRQPTMGSVVIAQDGNQRIYIGFCRLDAANSEVFAVVPQSRVFPVISSESTPGLKVRGTLVESRKYLLQ